MSIIGITGRNGYCAPCNSFVCGHGQQAQQQMNGLYNHLIQQAQHLGISTSGNISIANPNSVSVPSTVIKEKKVDKRLLLL